MEKNTSRLSNRLRPLVTVFFVVTSAPWFAWAVGRIFKDVCLITALCSYVPSPFLAAILAVEAFLLLCGSRKRLAVLTASLVVLPVASVCFLENQWCPPGVSRRAEQGFRLVHWNVTYGLMGWEKVVEELKAHDADIYVLSEAPSAPDVEALARQFGEAYDAFRYGNIVVVGRGIVGGGRRIYRGRAQAYAISWQREEGTVEILAADLPSNLLGERRALLIWLLQLAESDGSDVIGGDLNTPRFASTLEELPEGFAHAYDEAGSGWSYTWPVPFPMFPIDHCVVGPRLEVTGYRLKSTLLSDHQMQIVDLAVRSGAGS